MNTQICYVVFCHGHPGNNYNASIVSAWLTHEQARGEIARLKSAEPDVLYVYVPTLLGVSFNAANPTLAGVEAMRAAVLQDLQGDE